MYLQEKCPEAGILIGRDPNSFIKVVEVMLNVYLKVKVVLCLANTETINLNLENSCIIGTVTGTTHWAGKIYEKVVEGGNFAFVGHQLVVINKNSILSMMCENYILMGNIISWDC
jgi:hypothetical protein